MLKYFYFNIDSLFSFTIYLGKASDLEFIDWS